MRRIGIISDTHGTFDEPLREFLSEVDEIWHAGDIGSLAIADEIAQFKPLRAVYGNIDDATTRRAYTEHLTFMCEGVKVYMTHIGGTPKRPDARALKYITTLRPQLFICGHSHILRVGYDEERNMLCVNAGACGKYGFHRVRTAIRLIIDGDKMHSMQVGEWQR